MRKKTLKKNLLFVTRTYPPIIGGLQQYCYDFYNHLKERVPTKLFVRKTKEPLIVFLIRTQIYLLFNARKYTNIHFGDGMLSVFGRSIKKLSKAKVSVVIHGLEILHPYKWYQYIMKKSLPKMDIAVCVSKNTEKEAKKRGAKKTVFIPNGIVVTEHETYNKKELFQKLNIKPKGKILFSIARQTPLKGTAWFVENVMPKIHNNTYFVGGTGEEIPKIKQIITNKKLTNIYLLGRVDEKIKHSLYEHSDWFMMPNVRMKDDAEGFGITIIEAGLHGCPVIASNIDGIPSAVLQGKTGFLVEERNPQEFINAITKNKLNREEVKKKVFQTFEWNKIAQKYVEALDLKE